MLTLQLCLSADFEVLCNDRCKQSGSFALITTTMPSATENRLNEGWYHHNGPRKGTQSPPLAYAQDWCVTHQWSIVDSKAWITNTPEFKKVFDRPCVITGIEDHLMKDDNALFPELRARDLCKNGLDNVYILKKGTYPSPDDAGCDNDGSSKIRVVHSIVSQVQSVIDILGIEIVKTYEAVVEEDRDVTE